MFTVHKTFIDVGDKKNLVTLNFVLCLCISQKIDNKYTPAQTGLIGGGGKDVYTFKAVGAGSGQIDFTYK